MFSPIIINGRVARQVPCGRLTKAALLKDWPNKASTDPELLRTWNSVYLRAVPGILCDQWTVLDVDNLDWLREHELPLTYNYRTNRGRHFYFERVPHLKSSTGKIAPKVDVKTGAAIVIFYPHVNFLRPVEAPLAPFPEWLLEKLLPDRAEPRLQIQVSGASAPVTVSSSRNWGNSSNIAKTNDGLLLSDTKIPRSLYLKTIQLIPLSDKVRGRHQRHALSILRTLVQTRTGRNDELNTCAFWFRDLIRDGVISPENAASLLFDAATLNGYVAKDGAAAAWATILSGLGCRTAEAHSPLSDPAGVA